MAFPPDYFAPDYFPPDYFPPGPAANVGATAQPAQTTSGSGRVAVAEETGAFWGPPPFVRRVIRGHAGTIQAPQRTHATGVVDDVESLILLLAA